jgi:hypothetical protein
MTMTVDLNGSAAGTGTANSYLENQGNITLFSSATFVSTGQANSFADTMKILLSNPSPTELLSVTTLPDGYTSSYDAGVLIIHNGTGIISDANWQSVMRAVVYSNSSDDPLVTRIIKVSAADTIGAQTGTSFAATDTITITAVNDAPVVAGDLAATESPRVSRRHIFLSQVASADFSRLR